MELRDFLVVLFTSTSAGRIGDVMKISKDMIDFLAFMFLFAVTEWLLIELFKLVV
jgi:hypothetical protein